MSSKSRKQGIALVIVLGMLALLVMVGVAFSVFMRTERTAAGSFQHDVRARQLLYAAMARAIQTIDANMAGKIYPTENFWTSAGGATFLITTNDIWAAHVPDSLLAQVPTSAQWITVPNGRIGFLVLNASGLLDGNASGGGARGPGVSPSEIQLSEIPDVATLNTFVNNRAYESVAHMKRVGTAAGLNAVSHFVPFSMCSTNRALAPVDLTGDENALSSRRGDIIARFQLQTNGNVSLFKDIDANVVFNSLLDYVDADSRPQNTQSPTMERIPMINEIRIQPRLTRTANPDVMNLQIQTTVEIMYPFVKPPASTAYNLVYNISFERMVGTDGAFPVPAASGTLRLDSDFSWSGQPFMDVNLAVPSVPVTLSTLGGKTAAYRLKITELKIVERGGPDVDTLRANYTIGSGSDLNNYRPRITVPVATAPRVDGLVGGAECVDPRYNHAPAFWRAYSAITNITGNAGHINGSPAAINNWADYLLANGTNDGHIWMHVADEPLKSVGELSYLPRGLGNLDGAWKTLRLVDEDEAADPIYDGFELTPTNPVRRGLVNPGTDVKPVLASVFKDMVLERYPGDTTDDDKFTIDSGAANQLADAWMLDPAWDAGFFTTQDLVHNRTYLNAVRNFVNPKVPADVNLFPAGPFRVESAIRNLIGLMDPRQNFFYLILFAQSSSRVQLPRSGDTPGQIIDTVRSDQMAFVELWRDPVPRQHADGTAYYPMLIRRFEILSQE